MIYASIARIAHEVNRAYCQSIGDDSQLPWDQAPQWQKDSAIEGVKFHTQNPDAGPAAGHENWMKQKIDTGWRYGTVKDEIAETHHCMVPYRELPAQQRAKDSLFCAVVYAANAGEFA